MRLIDADRLYNTIIDEIDPISISMDGGEMRGMMRTIIAAEPTIESVPLDKLCEWLAVNASYIFGGYKNTWKFEARHWKDVLTKWMEEQDAAD